MMTIKKSPLLRIALPTPLRRHFDYLAPEGPKWQNLPTGVRIKVPFQRRELVGLLIGYTSETDVPWDKLRPAIEVLDTHPIVSKEIYQLCSWAADYYHYSFGDVLANALPILLRQGKPFILTKQSTDYIINNTQTNNTPTPPAITLNTQQQDAVNAIVMGRHIFQVLLLDGVTGSGKTEVYLQAMAAFLQEQKQILVLVPEIGLTPQTIQRFRERVSVPVAALHSGLTERERLNAWGLAKSGDAKIVIGTRSAVFTPLPRLGLIIVDEEHDLSFKQQDGFRYHARDVAIMRAHFAKVPIVLGSATPCLETLSNAQQGKYTHLHLTKRAGNAQLPHCVVLDIRNKKMEEGLSDPLLQEIKATLDRDEQVMLFLNRRGFAPILMCHHCGWMAQCKRCDARMTYHQESIRLHCHHCDTPKKIPQRCEGCGASDLQAIGLGTQRVESVLEKYFPAIPIARIDRDSTKRKGAMETLLRDIQSGKQRILIGTQMLSKGHHFPNVTLVGIIDADGGFFSGDFRSLERMGQLLLQVSGRAGRMEKPGKVIIQTHHPNHPLLHQLLNENYQQFAMSLLKERAETCLPPYTFFALFRADAYLLEHANHFMQTFRAHLQPINKQLELLGPMPAPMARRAGRYRMQLLVQANNRMVLQAFLKTAIIEIDKIPRKSHVRWSLDVDPVDMF
jgi:primosomal protein N' (replication factor Y) (superfamily II helicase)